MDFPTTGLLDDFNRANEDPLSGGGNWPGAFAVFSRPRVLSNQFIGDSAGNVSDSYWNALFGPDSEIFITLPLYTSSGGTIRLYFRGQQPGNATADGYALFCSFNTTTTIGLQLNRLDNGVFTSLGSAFLASFAAGDKLGAEIIGSTLRPYVYDNGAWTSPGTRTDSTYTAAGYIGAAVQGSLRPIDDFSGGTVVVYRVKKAWFDPSLEA